MHNESDVNESASSVGNESFADINTNLVNRKGRGMEKGLSSTEAVRSEIINSEESSTEPSHFRSLETLSSIRFLTKQKANKRSDADETKQRVSNEKDK